VGVAVAVGLAVAVGVSVGVAVADACRDLLSTARYVTEARGGEGAVREVVEAILKSRGDWHDVVTGYLASV
jgi:3-deoxy-D-manno-octulosonate 8-phosphate phosphatase (KDO 8-P phosphatase)